MFYSNAYDEVKKTLLIAFLIILLPSCTTLQTSNEKDVKTKQESSSLIRLSDSKKMNVGENSDSDFISLANIIDPMANIQINAEIKKSYKQTASFVKHKQYPNALRLMIKIKGKYPQLSGPNYQMARIYLQQRQFEKAIEQVDTSIKKNPRNYYSMSLKGVILKNQGKFEEAKLSYLKAIEIFPNYSKSHLNLGVLADVYLGEPSLALSEYNLYMRLTSNKDKKVANWVLEVERRLRASK